MAKESGDKKNKETENNKEIKEIKEEASGSRKTLSADEVAEKLEDAAFEARRAARKDRREAKQEAESSLGREIWDYVKLIAIAVVVMIVLQSFVIVNAKIPSASMETTIMTGDNIFGNRLVYKFSDPQRYDIIIFKYPDDESKLFIKRVIGLPGDTIDIHDGDVYVNGSEIPLEDSFCAEPDSTVGGNLTYPITVPEDSYFCLGDNRVYSKDSRYWENPFVRRDKILGKAFFRYWPLNKMKVIGGAGEGWYDPAKEEA